jgi:DNA repair ATPase RecN
MKCEILEARRCWCFSPTTLRRVLFTAGLFICSLFSRAQSAEAEQLLLDWEKLTQFKKILQNMYDGYKILYKGYTTVKDISQGSFSIHKNFLDALLEVSPAVKEYKRITDIIDYQIKIVKEYKSAFNQFKEDKSFAPKEMDYISKVYAGLLDRSLKSLDELMMVITSGTLRMSDDERLLAIDKIYNSIVDQFSFLRDFNSSASVLSLQRKSEQTEIEMSKILSK